MSDFYWPSNVDPNDLDVPEISDMCEDEFHAECHGCDCHCHTDEDNDV